MQPLLDRANMRITGTLKPHRSVLVALVAGWLCSPAVASPVHEAAKQGDIATLSQLLDLSLTRGELSNAGTALDAKDPEGSTPLIQAAGHGHQAAALYLIEKGADVNARNDHGNTALHVASFRGYGSVADVLIRHGAEVDARDKGGFTPLAWAAANGHQATVERLVDAGAAVDAPDLFGTTPLHWAAASGHTEVLEMLIARDAAVSARNRHGDTALHRAVEEGHPGAVDLLLSRGARVNAKNNEAVTPLHLAAAHGDAELVRRLVSSGADVNAEEKHGETPLLWATARNHQEVAQLLQTRSAELPADAHFKALQLQPHSGPDAKRPPRKRPLTGTLKTIEESGTIAIGHRQSAVPFSFVGPDRQPIGYSIDLCHEIVDAVAAEIGRGSLRIEWIPVTTQNRVALLAGGTIQMECGATTNTLSRQRDVDFTHVTFITGTKLLARKNSEIREFEDLSGKRVAVTQGTTNEIVVRTLIERQGLPTTVLTVPNHGEGLRALEADEIDAYATDHVLLQGLLQEAENPEALAVVGRFLSYEPYGIMVPRDDSAFRLVANRALSNLFRDRAIDEIYDKWFAPLSVPLTAELEAALRLQALPE